MATSIWADRAKVSEVMPVSKSGIYYTQSDTRSFDQYLDDNGMREAADAAAEKMYIAYQLEEARKHQKVTKKELAERIGTSRAQLDRVLDRPNQNVTIDTLKRIAEALGKQLRLELI
jgi:antitoxin HicB